jgi:hypothetical protein
LSPDPQERTPDRPPPRPFPAESKGKAGRCAPASRTGRRLSGVGAATTLRTVSGTRTSLAALFLALALPLAGCLLWMLHADAWGLGGRSPVLNYD